MNYIAAKIFSRCNLFKSNSNIWTGPNATGPTGTKSCPEGLTECLFEGVVTMDYMIYFNFFGCVLLPLLLMLIIYAHIFMAARRQLHHMGPKVTPIPSPREISSPSKSSQSTLKKEMHAAKSLAIIVGLFALCWLPLHIINCFNYLCQNCDRTHIWVMNTAIILSHTNSVINPFIYAYRIREFRQTFQRIIYEHILGRRGGQVSEARAGDDQTVANNSIIRSPSATSKDDSFGSTVVNSYILDTVSERTPPFTTDDSCSHWISTIEDVPSTIIPNKQDVNSPTHSVIQPGIMEFTVQNVSEFPKNLQEKTDIWEVHNRGSIITFVNVKHTDCVCPTSLTDVS